MYLFFNIVILYRLTKWEGHRFSTEEQTSLAKKSIIALLINSCVIPFLINRFVKRNIFGVEGLADDVLFLSLYNAVFNPILKVISLSYLFSQFFHWAKSSLSKLELSQHSYNHKYLNIKRIEYEVGY